MIDQKTRNVVKKDEYEDYSPPTKYIISKQGLEEPEYGVKTKSVLNSTHDVSEVINSWKNPWDKLSVNSVAPILGFASVATGCFVNRHFRETLYLTSTGRVSSYLVMVLFPSVTAGTAHYHRISQRLFTSQEKCSTCTQVRAGIMQLLTGVLYPASLVPLVSYAIASREKHYNMPKLNLKKPTEILIFTREIFRPIVPKLFVIAAIQLILTMGLTYYEQHMYYTKILPVLNARKNLQMTSTPSSSVLVPKAADEFDHEIL